MTLKLQKMDSNFRYAGIHWLQGSNASLSETGICPQKKPLEL